jgi:hypothetical protein
MYSENEILFIENKIRADERERIIKLLELWWEDSDMTYQECIAQIKGAK